MAIQKLREIRVFMERAAAGSRQSMTTPILVGACKGQSADALKSFLEAGLRHFGENYVQEALTKWPELRRKFPDVVLHCIGPLQTNKAKDAVALFDVIETLDREKIAQAIAKEAQRQQKMPKCLIQVNIGEESGKSGIAPQALEDFFHYCRSELVLPIEGLMCIPPAAEPPAPYFALMRTWADRLRLTTLSMGMSADYEEAIRFGATHVRIGTALFGARKSVV